MSPFIGLCFHRQSVYIFPYFASETSSNRIGELSHAGLQHKLSDDVSISMVALKASCYHDRQVSIMVFIGEVIMIRWLHQFPYILNKGPWYVSVGR